MSSYSPRKSLSNVRYALYAAKKALRGQRPKAIRSGRKNYDTEVIWTSK